MFPWSNSSVSLAETARRNTLNYIENRKKTIDVAADQFFTFIAKDIIEYSTKNSTSDKTFNITDPKVHRNLTVLSGATHQERYDILKKVAEKLQEEKFVCRTDGTNLYVSWEPEKPTSQMIYFYDKGPHCEKLMPVWADVETKMRGKDCLTSVNIKESGYENYPKHVTVVPTIRIYPKGFADHDNFVEFTGDAVSSAMTEFTNSY